MLLIVTLQIEICNPILIMNMIGYGLKRLRTRLSIPFWIALSFLVLVFIADTFTTMSAGQDAWKEDLNPIIRTLSPANYCISAVIRCICGIVILAWFWPETLFLKYPNLHRLVWLFPFLYQKPVNYFGAVLIMIATPVKAFAAFNNFSAINGITYPLSASTSIGLGLLLGILYAGILFGWHSLRQHMIACQ